jgi:hypothetical protein
MTHVDLDDLADLVLEPGATPDSVREHVESCAECTDRLSALFDVRRLASGEPLVAPPARVREQVLAQVGENTEDAPARSAPLCVASSTTQAARPRHRVPMWAAGLAAGVALVAGLGVGRLTVDDAAPPQADAPGAVVAAADLTALDSTAGRGVARAVESDDTITLRVQASELGGDEGFHEVWLINVDGKRMVALGVLADGDSGEFQVPRGLLDEGYSIVDISVEPEDGDPTHSGVSLARGELV